MVAEAHGTRHHGRAAGHDRLRADTRADDDSVDVTARVYHTENENIHLEGETYAVTDRALAETLRGIGFVSIEGWTDTPPAAPTITGLTPSTALAGTASVPVVVAGTGFSPDSVIVWDGADLPTTVDSETSASATADLTAAGAGVIPVAVRAGGVLSASQSFTVTAARRR
jgi:hypothetical protein